MNRLKLLIQTLYNHPFVRFAFVGGMASLVNYGIYLVAVRANIEPTFAYLIAFGVSIICNYVLSSYFTFQIPPTWSRAVKFLGAHLLNLLNELLLLNLFIYLGVSKFYAPLLVFATAFPINFFMVRFALKGKWSRLIRKR